MSFGRRVRTVWEIEEYDQYREVAVWNPRNDSFETWFEDSYLLERIAVSRGQTKQDLLKELEARTKYIASLVEEGVRDQKDVAEKILSYYAKRRGGKEKSATEKAEKGDKAKGQSGDKLDDMIKKILVRQSSSDEAEEPESPSPELGRAASLGSRSQKTPKEARRR